MDSDDDAVAEKDPTGRYIRYGQLIGNDGVLFKQYKAFDQNNGVEVAWNQVSIDDGLISPVQFRSLCEEIDLLKSLKHKNVVRFHDSWIDQENKKMNIITETFASGSLKEYRTKHKKIDTKVIKNWGRQILRGMQYLLSHNPPVVIQDLASDKVFVNGNNGEVKIGLNCRLLAILNNKLQPAAQSNQLCFGMCMLEMVTAADNLYHESEHSVLMHKVAVALSTMSDPQAKHFIHKCLSVRLSATELLEDPFLATHGSVKEDVRSDSSSSESSDKKLHSESHSPNVTDVGKANSKKSVQLAASSKKKVYGLRGVRSDEKTMSFTLDVADKQSGSPKKIEFPFYLQSDTSVSVAEEMIQQLEFSREDVAVVVGLIDALLMEFKFDGCSNNKDAIDNAVTQQNSSLPSPKQKENESKESSKFASEQPKKPGGKNNSLQQLLKNISIL